MVVLWNDHYILIAVVLCLSISMSGLGVLAQTKQKRQQRLAGECANMCNEMMADVITADICAEAKKTTPVPKLGSFCSSAAERGYRDSCLALCMNMKPSFDIAPACRAAAIELPRPTVRNWCERGYREAFSRAKTHLSALFHQDASESEDASSSGKGSASTRGDPEAAMKSGAPTVAKDEEARGGVQRVMLRNKKVTIEVAPGQDVEDAVVVYCSRNGEIDASECIRIILPQVLDREL